MLKKLKNYLSRLYKLLFPCSFIFFFFFDVLGNVSYEFVFESKIGDRYFVDKNEIEFRNNIKRVKILTDFNRVSPPKYMNKNVLSSFELEEFNCVNNSHRSINRRYFSLHQLEGLKIYDSNIPGRFNFLNPSSGLFQVMRYLCDN